MAVDIIQSGLQGYRIEWVRENTIGTIPPTPTFKLFSDTVLSEGWSPDAQITPLRGIGDADPTDFDRGPETHDWQVVYYLQHTISANVDPAYDGIWRDADNRVPNSHSVVVRRNEATKGDASGGLREYLVLSGGKINQVEVTGDPGAAEPIRVSLNYNFMKGRYYQIHQPSSASLLFAKSSVAGDGQTLTVENQGGAKNEALTLTGATAVSTSSTYANVDAAWLSSGASGNITIGLNTGTANTITEGTTLMTIYGSGAYDSIEGDRGVPFVGATGTHPSALSLTYEKFLDDTVSRPAGTNLAYALSSVAFRVNNNLSRQAQSNTLQQRLLDGVRTAEIDATVFGEEELYDKVIEHLRKTSNHIVWNLTRTNIQLSNAVLRDIGDHTIEAESAMATLDNTFEGKGVTLT